MNQEIQGYIDTAVELGIEFAPKIVGALAVILIGRKIASKVTASITSQMEKRSGDPTAGRFLGKLSGVVLDVLIYLAAINTLGIPTTSFVAILGAAGLAIGLALQGTLQHFSSGVLLVLLRPFKVGDVVDAGGVVGSVEEVGVFTTTLVTPDNRVILVPNANITGANITNLSAKPTRRVDLSFGVGYGDDLKAAKQMLLDMADADDRVLPEPAAFVAVSELGDSSVNFTVRLWVKSEDYWNVFFDWNENGKLKLDEGGFNIPYPTTDVHIVSNPN